MATKKSTSAAERAAIEQLAAQEAERLARDAAAATVESKLARKMEKLGEGLTDRAARTRAKAREVETKAARHAARMEHLAEGIEAMGLWLREEPGVRRPRWSREDLAGAAVAVADAEGLVALSMRRLAAELGAGTMSLYHYVRTKDEVLALAVDAVLGEVLLDDHELAAGKWQDRMRIVATRTRDALVRHPWVLDVVDGPAIGPNSVRHFDQTFGALAGLDAELETKLDIIFTVDEYVFGYCLQRRNDLADDAQTDPAAIVGYYERLIAGGSYPNLDALVAEHGAMGLYDRVQHNAADADRFHRNLDRLLNGIAAEIGS